MWGDYICFVSVPYALSEACVLSHLAFFHSMTYIYMIHKYDTAVCVLSYWSMSPVSHNEIHTFIFYTDSLTLFSECYRKVVSRSRKYNPDVGLSLKLQLLFYIYLLYFLIFTYQCEVFVDKYIRIHTCNSNHKMTDINLWCSFFVYC